MVKVYKDGKRMDFSDLLKQMSEARKHRLHFHFEKIPSQENVKVYQDMLKALESIKDNSMDTLIIYEDRLFVPREELIDYLFEDGYLSYELDERNARFYFLSSKVSDLKKILQSFDLKISGKKEELVNRIMENIPLSKFASDDILITAKAFDFLDEWGWLMDYGFILREFDKQDFFFYYLEKADMSQRKDNERLNVEKEEIMMELKDISIEYLDKHMEIALDEGDFDYILHCLRAKSHVYRFHKDCKRYLDFQMRIFDMIFTYSDFFASPIFRDYSDYVRQLKRLPKFFDKETIYDSFNENWDFLNHEIFEIEKEDAEIILDKILNNIRVDELNKFIRKTYFPERDYSLKDISEFLNESNDTQSDLDDFFS